MVLAPVFSEAEPHPPVLGPVDAAAIPPPATAAAAAVSKSEFIRCCGVRCDFNQSSERDRQHENLSSFVYARKYVCG